MGDLQMSMSLLSLTGQYNIIHLMDQTVGGMYTYIKHNIIHRIPPIYYIVAGFICKPFMNSS